MGERFSKFRIFGLLVVGDCEVGVHSEVRFISICVYIVCVCVCVCVYMCVLVTKLMGTEKEQSRLLNEKVMDITDLKFTSDQI